MEYYTIRDVFLETFAIAWGGRGRGGGRGERPRPPAFTDNSPFFDNPSRPSRPLRPSHRLGALRAGAEGLSFKHRGDS